MSIGKPHILEPTKQLHDFASEKPVKAPEKSFLLLTVKELAQKFGFITIKPIQAKIAVNHEIFSPTTEIELIAFTGSKDF